MKKIAFLVLLIVASVTGCKSKSDVKAPEGDTAGMTCMSGTTPASVVNGIDLSRLPFTPDSIKQVVLSYQPQIQACYEETLAGKDKAVEGSLKTSFSITGDGMTAFSKVDKKGSSLKDPRLHDCVIAVLSTMQFPAPPDGKAHPIEFPFNLKAVH